MANSTTEIQRITMKYPGETYEEYPAVFNTVPVQKRLKKDGYLSDKDLRIFFDQGFLLIDSFFKSEELEPVKQAIDELVDELAERLYEAGKIKSLYKEFSFSNRLTKLEEDFPGACVILHKIGKLPEVTSSPACKLARHKGNKNFLIQSFKRLWSNERLLNLAEQIIGTSDVGGSPVWNLRTKVPNVIAGIVPWHQDSSYLDNESYKFLQLIAWIPLVDSNITNGCMQVVRNGHRRGKVGRHTGCWKDTWYLMMEEEEIEQTLGCSMEKDVVTCEVPYGGLLIFSNMTPHRSVVNVSKEIRWSLDFRWQDMNKPDGFYGLKECIRMRSSDDHEFKINWDTFDSVSRHDKQDEDCQREEKDDFDTTIPGPWMKKWQMVNTNRHTKALEKMTDTPDWKPNKMLVG